MDPWVDEDLWSRGLKVMAGRSPTTQPYVALHQDCFRFDYQQLHARPISLRNASQKHRTLIYEALGNHNCTFSKFGYGENQALQCYISHLHLE